jgi:hypothetical protein
MTPVLESPQYFTVAVRSLTEVDLIGALRNEASAIEFGGVNGSKSLQHWARVTTSLTDQFEDGSTTLALESRTYFTAVVHYCAEVDSIGALRNDASATEFGGVEDGSTTPALESSKCFTVFISSETAADICFVLLWLTRPQPTRCYAPLYPAVLYYKRLSAPLQPTLSGETKADSLLLSSLSIDTTLRPTICYASLYLARLRLTICFIYSALLCVAVLRIQLDYLPFCQERLQLTLSAALFSVSSGTIFNRLSTSPLSI